MSPLQCVAILAVTLSIDNVVIVLIVIFGVHDACFDNSHQCIMSVIQAVYCPHVIVVIDIGYTVILFVVGTWRVGITIGQVVRRFNLCCLICD